MGNVLSESITKSDLSDVLAQVADLTISTITGTSLPVATGLKSLYNATIEIKERLFYKKLLKFLNEIKDIPQSERIVFHDRITKKGSDVWEKMLVLIHDLDNINKATIYGSLLRNAIIGKIDYNDFKRLSYVIEVLYYDDIISFFDMTNAISGNDKNGELFKYLNLGLIKQSVRLSHSNLYNRNTSLGLHTEQEELKEDIGYSISDLGSILIEFGKN